MANRAIGSLIILGLVLGGCSGGSGDGSDGGGTDAADASGGDGSNWNGPCSTNTDCPSEQYCLPPGVSPGCGEPCVPERACELDADCAQYGESFICVEYVSSCCTASQPSSRCQEKCSVESCEESYRCDDRGECVPLHCTEGFTCPDYTECQAAAPEHGCVRLTCVSDDDCSGGTCVMGKCYQEMGQCSSPVP